MQLPEDLQLTEKPYCKSKWKAVFPEVINKPIPILYKLFEDLIDYRKKTNRMVVFSCRPVPTSLNTGTTNETFQ